MPYRCWLPLLLICVLAAEGVLGAWVGARMALDTAASVAAASDVAVQADCAPSKPVLAKAHAGHGKPGGTDATDCTCGDSTGCECACVLALYPPTTVALFAGSYPPVTFDVPLPVLQLPASKLSRVFRPPIA